MSTPRQILIIEDKNSDENLLLRHPRADIHQYIRAIHDGGKALDVLTDERFKCEGLAAIFLDLNLPTVSGLSILETLRSSDRLRNVPVIVMTSQNSEEELQRCRELGVVCFVPKPLGFASFAKAFADTFDSRRAFAEQTKALSPR